MSDNIGMSLSYWNNVNKEIKNQNTTQEWIAKRSGIKYLTLKGWISKGVLPRIDDAIKIADALAVSSEFLLTGKEKKNDFQERTLYKRALKYEQVIDDLEIISPDKRKTIMEMISLCADNSRETSGKLAR